MDDWQLLHQFAESRSNAIFEEIVRRHLKLVFGAARRQVNDAHLAQDVTQAVFVLLAEKAEKIGPATHLPVWLLKTTYFLAKRALRTERRRLVRERIALETNAIGTADEMPSATGSVPVINEALNELGEMDRVAVTLRFFEGNSLKEVGVELGISEEAAKKRVARALQKLRGKLGRKGLHFSSSTLAAAVAAGSAQAAPAKLLASVCLAVNPGQSSAISASLVQLLKKGLDMIMVSKWQAAGACSVSILLGAGIAATFLNVQAPREIPRNIPAPEMASAADSGRSSSGNPISPPPAASRFDWRQVESDDYRKYIANLRSVGCPEETIRDIIVADVNKLFRERERSYTPTNTFHFWKTGLSNTQGLAEEMAEVRTAHAKEKREVLATLLGTEVAANADLSPKVREIDLFYDALLSYLPESKRVQAQDIAQEFVRQATKTFQDGVSRAGLAAYPELVQQKEEALRAVLSPEEYEEFELRTSSEAQSLRGNYAGADFTEDEFRQIFSFARQYARERDPFLVGVVGHEEREFADKQIDNKIKETIGEKRYREFLEARRVHFHKRFPAYGF